MYTAIPPKKEAQINSAPSAAVLSDLCDKALDPPRTIKSPMPRKPSSQGHDTRYTKLQKNLCFACGQNNPDGMHLKFTIDEKRQMTVCRFRLDARYTGPPGHCHGGIIATILDDAMGKVNKLRHVVALTREMTVEYLKPVPLHKQLRVEGREVQVRGRTHVNVAEIVNAKGEVLARSKGIFIAIDPEQMFAKYVER
ncbi:MAG: PaaI family thioesterase [Acidobacteria bacterium]|nr:MAG: PaaI family thioesterase [Acidobacteriota bacterium]